MLKIITSLAIFATVMPANAQSKALSPFNKITVTDRIEITYRQDPQSTIEVTSPGGFSTGLKFSVKKGSLEISNPENRDIAKIIVSSPELIAVKASSESKVMLKSPLQNALFLLNLHSGATFSGTVITGAAGLSAKSGSIINLKLDANSVSGNFDSNAKVNISGAAKISDIRTSGNALYRARNFVVETSHVNASGNSTAMVYAAHDLNLMVDEKATIRYFGVPHKLSVNPEAISMLRCDGQLLATN